MIAVLGAFDGFHRGHAYLFGRARETAASLGLEWGGVTFEPHPKLYMGTIEKVLFTLRERQLIRLFLGIPKLIVLNFDDELARFSPENFWEYLSGQITVDGIVVGRDFRFGCRRLGDARLLEQYSREAGVFFLSADLVQHMGAKIASSTVRAEVAAGRCESAAGELGYPHFICSEVRRGLGRGRRLGFPTANLDVSGVKLMPPDGVYAAAVLVKGEWRAGALSMGKNPTFDDVPDVRAEVFVPDYEGDLYGESLLVFFLSRLRPQERFKDAPQLATQIEADVERSKVIFKHSLELSPDCYSGFMGAYAEIYGRSAI
ncbi:MAG: riboflavin biosynthesis protein RibF [Synergistaceae bacterium]|nr:riboflavin biosynthesis protein RibF [Synergistaceae bacterium]